jgi:S-formylglutathione hydrolase
MAFTTKSTIASFGGQLLKLSHASETTGTDMAVSVYLPPQAVKEGSKVPVLIYLSGLTCSPDNCSEKGFFQHGAARAGIAVVYPDTSPRGLGLPGEKDSWDFGEAASFYIDSTREPFATNYKMETYLTKELPGLLFREFADKLDGSRVSITGHSMGGHGALTLYLKHPELYKSVSAFAPIANPSQCPWGEKAFKGYLGEDREAWKAHDATELVKGWKGGDLKMLVDVGTGDNFYKQGQLLPENFEKAVKEAGLSGLTLRYQKVSLGCASCQDGNWDQNADCVVGLRPLVLLHGLLQRRPRRACG